MSSAKVKKTIAQKVKRLSPFGIGHTKPKHFRDMLKVVWENRDNLGYAWKVLTKGVCDGCALGVAGLHDWTIDGVHLCMTRLNLLRLNTMPALDVELLSDVSKLKNKSNADLRRLGRIPYPMLRRSGESGFSRISWDESYQILSERLREIDPRRLAFFVTSRGVTNEVYYIAQKVARFLGTNNVDNAARLCHSPSTAAMKAAIGYTATTCSYKDLYGTDLIVFFGANPANDQPVMTKYLHEAKKQGTKIALVNPYDEPAMNRYWVPSSVDSALFGTDITDYWFPVSQGSDIAFLYGVLKILFENDWLNHEFIQKYTVNVDQLRAQADKVSWADIVQQTGLTQNVIQEFAELIRDAKNAVLVWSMGITQHPWGADGVQMILNLGLLRGYVGREKNGLMPIRGHSSVQGGAEMGAYSTVFPGGLPINNDNADDLSRQYGFKVPNWTGITTTEMIDAAYAGELDLFFCLGGNFLRNLPEPDYIAKALSNVPLRVHQDIILTDQMFVDPGSDGVLLLPAKTRYEQDDGGIETTTERRIAFSPEISRQVGEAKAEWKILLELAQATWPEKADKLGCEDGWKVREEIARVVPFYDGVQHLRKTHDAVQYGGPQLCTEGNFATPDGNAHFISVDLPPLRLKKGLFFASTRRGKQFNSLIYANLDPINGAKRESVLINERDAEELGLVDGDPIRLKNDLGEFRGTVFKAPIATGNLQIHWPEGNTIIHRGSIDARGGVPNYNAWVSLEKI